MSLNKMVGELKEPLRSFVVEFVKDCYEHRQDEVDENVIKLLYQIKQRYIKNAPLN